MGKLCLGQTNTRKANTQWEWRDGESGTYPPSKGPPKKGGVLSGGADLFMQWRIRGNGRHTKLRETYVVWLEILSWVNRFGSPLYPRTLETWSLTCNLSQDVNIWIKMMLHWWDGEIRLDAMAEPPELFQLKCLSHASRAATHINRNNPSVPQI